MKIFNIVSLIALTLALVGCKAKREIVTHTVEVHDTLYYERVYADTAVHFDGDTASARLLAECDESNNAILSIVDQLTGDKTSLEALVRYYEEAGKETGEKHRKAIVDITAVVKAQDMEIKVLKEKLAAASDINQREHKEKEIEPKTIGLKGLLIAFLSGGAITFIITTKLKNHV